MKKTAFLLFLSLHSISLFAQLIPVQNSEKELGDLNVKTLSTFFVDADVGKEHLIFQKEYDASRKLLEKYQLSLWEAVSYSHTTTYKYNDQDQLESELILQEFLKIYDRDQDYLDLFGTKPLNEKRIYLYNDQGKMSKKMIYTFGDKEPGEGDAANQSIDYEYENDMLISEESTSTDDKFFNQNYLIKYTYDSADNLIQKVMAYGKEKEFQRNFFFKYNTEGQMTEEQVIDLSIPHNNIHLKYEYNKESQRSKKLVFNENEEVFEEETSYQYNLNGNMISGDREVKFEYYNNGLIKSESWIDPTSSEHITLISKYEFF